MKAKSILPAFLEKAGDPENALRNLHGEIDRVFDEFSRGSFNPFRFGENGKLSPAMDVAETDDSMEITAELPGVSEDDVEVSITDRRLTIKGEKKSETESEEADKHIVERSYGSFLRSMHLPFDVDIAAVSASFEKGVLKIMLPKPPEVASKTKKIEIKSGA